MSDSLTPFISLSGELVPVRLPFLGSNSPRRMAVKISQKPEGRHGNDVPRHRYKEQLVCNRSLHSDNGSVNLCYVRKREARVLEGAAGIDVGCMREKLVAECNELFRRARFEPLLQLVKDAAFD